MSMKRGRPGVSAVRKGERVGPDYPKGEFENPFNAGIERYYEEGEDQKTLVSPNDNTVTGVVPMRKGSYDKNWE